MISKPSQLINSRSDIAVFIHSLAGGGAERVAVTLCNAFADEGKKVHLVVVNKEGAYWENLSPKVEVVNLQRRSMIQALLPLTRYLYTHRPPILLCFMTKANAVGVLANMFALKPSRVVVNERVTYSFVTGTKRGMSRLIALGLPQIYHFADRLICVSQSVGADLRQFVSLPANKVTVIYNPTVRKDLYLLKETAVDHPWVAPDQPPVLLAVGRLEPQKNYDLLLHSFANIDKSLRARLLILGEGGERKKLEQLMHHLEIEDCVDMPGFRNNPYAYMAKATAFITCSDAEGLSNVLIEALACGCPVIATDCAGNDEILDDGQYGLLIRKGSQELLTAAINTTLRDIAAAKERVTAFHKNQIHLFTPETVIPQYMEALGL